MILLDVNQLSFAYPSQPEMLFSELSFVVDQSSRVGLIGGNGTGKTTLLKLILGKIAPVAGTVAAEKELSVGYLPQEVGFEDSLLVRDYLWQVRTDLADLRQKVDESKPESVAYAEAVAEFYARGGDRFESNIARLLADFRMPEDKLDLPLTTLSGGEKTKTALIRLLLSERSLLLLDEPTNHLEIRSRIWLESYLKNCGIPYVIVSHDRRFLDRTVAEIWELKDGRLEKFSGDYSFYRHEKDVRRKRLERLYEQQHRKIRRLEAAATERKQDAQKMEKFKTKRSVSKKGAVQKRDDGSGSGKSDAKKKMRTATVLSKRIEKEIAREAELKPFVEKERKIQLRDSDLRNPVAFDIKEISKSFGADTVFSSLSMTVATGSKIGVIGSNGSGKSTLLRILMEEVRPDSGSVARAPQVRPGYFAQEHEQLNPDASILDEVLQGRLAEQAMARTILGGLNIRGDKVFQTVGSLSQGERSKAALAKVLFSDANVLLLDEPTNHLELESLEAFEGALKEYVGTVILVTHDRYLLNEIATAILDMDSCRFYAGRFSEYEGPYLAGK